MKYFTICLPSNRSLRPSKASIESAIAFTAQANGNLIVSDNSNDVEKAAFFKTVPEHVLYLNTAGFSAIDNLLSCLAQVKTEFILPMGDDDFIRLSPDVPLFDFSRVDEKVICVKPFTELLAPNIGIVATSVFSIEETSPLERMRAYCDKSNGNNATFYSYYRKICFEGLLKLIADHHPTKGGYIDWAMVLALVSMGQMAEDPATILTYNIGNWGGTQDIEAGRVALFRKAQMPAGAENFEALFNFLDCCAFVSCNASPLAADEKVNARNGAALIYIRQFLDDVDRAPASYIEQGVLIEALRLETLKPDTQPESMIPHALIIAEAVKPGLAESYASFLGHSMGA